MRQARHLHDGADVVGRERLGQRATRLQRFAHLDANAAAHGGHLDAVRQPVMDVVVLRQRVHLGLAAQAAEGARENHAVVVLQVFRAALVAALVARAVVRNQSVFHLELARGQQIFPLHTGPPWHALLFTLF